MNDQKNKQQQPQQGNKQNQPGQQNPSNQQSSKQSNPSQGGNMKNQGGDIGEGDIEHPDQQPDKKVKIGDNPDETQKKVPNMHSKH